VRATGLVHLDAEKLLDIYIEVEAPHNWWTPERQIFGSVGRVFDYGSYGPRFTLEFKAEAAHRGDRYRENDC
jgi:hypothetical protein